MSNLSIKSISEKDTNNSASNQEKQVKLVFETPDKTDVIQLSGNGELKVSAPILM